jgi:protein ImuB
MRRLDQALGAVPEPLSAIAPPPPMAVRLSLPEPIGLLDDLREGAARLLARLCARLAERGEGARALRLEARGADGGVQAVGLRLARPMRDAEAMLALLVPRLERIEAGFGIDMLRLDAPQTERIVPEQMRGAGQAAARGDALADLLTRLGARVGLEAITRRHPADSHIPGKTALSLAAAWSDPAAAPWPRHGHPRPLMLWRPEPVTPQAGGRPCAVFHWRGRRHETAHAIGPERIAPEWWLDDPEWRTGLRDYWQVLTTRGERLWLFQAHGAALSGGWFCHGRFA